MSISRSTLMTQIETYTLNRGSATILQRFFPKVLSLNHARVLVPKAMDLTSVEGGSPFLPTSSSPTDYESGGNLFPGSKGRVEINHLEFVDPENVGQGPQGQSLFKPSSVTQATQTLLGRSIQEALEWREKAISWSAIKQVPVDRIGEKGQLIHNLVSEEKKGQLCSNTQDLNMLASKMSLRMHSLKDVCHIIQKGFWMAKLDLSKFYWALLIHHLIADTSDFKWMGTYSNGGQSHSAISTPCRSWHGSWSQCR
jgi:hypothetical protein